MAHSRRPRGTPWRRVPRPMRLGLGQVETINSVFSRHISHIFGAPFDSCSVPVPRSGAFGKRTRSLPSVFRGRRADLRHRSVATQFGANTADATPKRCQSGWVPGPEGYQSGLVRVHRGQLDEGAKGAIRAIPPRRRTARPSFQLFSRTPTSPVGPTRPCRHSRPSSWRSPPCTRPPGSCSRTTGWLASRSRRWQHPGD